MEAQRYLEELKDIIENLHLEEIETITEVLLEAYHNNRQVFIMGNGGSASTASHFTCDLGKGTVNSQSGKRLRVIALSDNIPLMTAWANDTDYANIFAQQLENLINPRDVVIGISGSGNSMNVIRAFETARLFNAVTIGLTGFSGGKLANLSHHVIIVPSDNMQQIEDAHLMIAHLIFSIIRDRLDGDGIDEKRSFVLERVS